MSSAVSRSYLPANPPAATLNGICAVVGGMATDFRDGKTFPRRGRTQLGDFLWLARVYDKARANANGTIHDYIYPCPMDQGVFERWGINSSEFDTAIRENPSDEQILAWATNRIPPDRVKAANDWVSVEKKANLDRQDSEEGVTVA